jgi:hypothetical protein
MQLSPIVSMTKPLLQPMILFHILHRRLDHRLSKSKVFRSDDIALLLNGALCGFADQIPKISAAVALATFYGDLEDLSYIVDWFAA